MKNVLSESSRLFSTFSSKGSVFCFIFFIYVYLAGRLTLDFPVTTANYFSLLAQSFLHGKLSFISMPRTDLDLTFYHNKVYMYWGPAPVLLILPFVLFLGVNISDAFYTAIIGAINPIILYLCLRELNNLRFVKISESIRLALCLFFALGTSHYYLSVMGQVWHTSQIASTFYLLTALLFVLKYLSNTRYKNLILSAFFLSLTVYSRFSTLFYLPFFLSIFLIKLSKKEFTGRTVYYHLISFLLIPILFFVVFSLYNYLRFNSFFENGYTYHNFYREAFLADYEKYGFFNLAYLPRNFYYMFLNFPSITSAFPFIRFDLMGNSLFFTSPLFVVLALIVKKRYWQTQTLALFNTAISLSVLSTLLFLLLFWGTGYTQFGSRYLLDIIPLLIFLVAQISINIPGSLFLTLISLSIIINTFGTFWFLGFLGRY